MWNGSRHMIWIFAVRKMVAKRRVQQRSQKGLLMIFSGHEVPIHMGINTYPALKKR
jgi:hypothetical protein